MRRALSRLRRWWQVRRGYGALMRSPLMDPIWYAQTYPDIGNFDPISHYLAYGAAEGRDPGPGFSTSGYQIAGQALDGNPLLHYLQQGQAAGRAALPRFAGQIPHNPDRETVIFAAHQVPSTPFGAERSFLDMLERALAGGITPEVVVPHLLSRDYLAALQARCHAVHVIPYGWRRAGYAPHAQTLAAFQRVIAGSGAREVHQNTLAVDAPLAAARHAGIRGVLWLREIPVQDPALSGRIGQSDLDHLRQDLWAEADRIIANSDATAAWIDPDRSLGPRLLVVPNPIEPDLFTLPFTPQDPLRVGIVGSLTAKKGIADFIALAQAYHALGARGEFRLIGPNSVDLDALAPLPSGVRHLGALPTPRAAMAEIDVLVSLSRVPESFGRTVTEAMAAGRPVLCNDLGAPPSLVGAAGAVVAAGDIQAAALALQGIAADLPRLSALARARAEALDRASREIAPARIFTTLDPVAFAEPLP